MAMFTGFKPQGLQKIASRMGYAGQMDKFDQYLEQNPDKQREMIVYQGKAQEMARGGMVNKMAVGGVTNPRVLPQGAVRETGAYANTDVALRSLDQLKQVEIDELKAISDKSEETLRKINYLQNELKLKSKF